MRRMASTLAFALMIPLTACDRSPTAVEASQEVSGTYHLRAVNGTPLPFILATQGEAWLEISSGYLQFNADRRFIDVLMLSVKEEGETLEEEEDRVEGTWSQSGSTVTMLLDAGGSVPVTVTVRGDTLTQVINQFTLRYVRD
jgi:hypothetical protein